MREISVVLISGDGIGEEISSAMVKVIDSAVSTVYKNETKILWINAEAGLKVIERGGTGLPEETLDLIKKHRVAIKGPTETPVGGGHRSVNVELRQKLDLYANIRPIRWFKGIATPIHRPEDVDLVIFRENTEDVYTGIEFSAGSQKAKDLYKFIGEPSSVSPNSAFGIKPVSEKASRRIMRRAIKFALENNRKRITIVHKGNIMKQTEGAFFQWALDEAKVLLANNFLDSEEYKIKGASALSEGKILVQNRIADAMFQELLLRPSNHEILVTMNLNGDYLSDAAAALVGGLGLAPGANIGDDIALFEAVHGTAPDIAGKDIANPSALILSAAMMLDYLGLSEAGKRVTSAIEKAIATGQVTKDLSGNNPALSCSKYTNNLIELLK